jgi:hypothetical protein
LSHKQWTEWPSYAKLYARDFGAAPLGNISYHSHSAYDTIIDKFSTCQSTSFANSPLAQYRAIATHAPVALCGILSIGIGQWISCQDLHDKLCTAECDSCGDFWGYLYLITCRRVCFLCFTEATDYLPLRQVDAIRKFGLSREHLANLPAMKTVSGCYSPRSIKVRKGLTLIDHSAARDAGLAVHGSASAMEEFTSNIALEKLKKYEIRHSQLIARTGRSITRRPRTEDEFDGHTSNPLRFVAIVRAPYLDRRLRSPEWGFHCVGCKLHHYDPPLHWRRRFTDESYKRHITECGQVIGGKHARQCVQGQRLP